MLANRKRGKKGTFCPRKRRQKRHSCSRSHTLYWIIIISQRTLSPDTLGCQPGIYLFFPKPGTVQGSYSPAGKPGLRGRGPSTTAHHSVTPGPPAPGSFGLTSRQLFNLSNFPGSSLLSWEYLSQELVNIRASAFIKCFHVHPVTWSS